jgi:beta-glucosidase
MGRQSVLLLLLFHVASPDAGIAQAPYRDSTLPVSSRVKDLVGRMTLEEKFWQLFMIPGAIGDSGSDYASGVFGLQDRAAPDARADAVRQNAMQRYMIERTRLGIPALPFEEAVHGLMRNGATVFPVAIGLAATWDSALVGRMAHATAREARSRGVRDVLSPVVNIATDVRWGRVEETYGEDPYLASVMARAFVREFEALGVVTTPKHFVANVGEGGRDSYPIDVSRRTLEETHFPPFRAAIHDAGARSVMTAYNSVDGVPATQNAALLSGILKRDWGFTGFVISDAAATSGATVLHHTEASTAAAAQHALQAGLDVIFQSSWPQHRPYLDALQRGLVADSVIDAAVARVLRAKVELGLFERPYVDPDSAAYWNGHSEHRTLAREVARASIVLLKNERNVLPLSRATKSVAVIGVDAAEPRLGGYTMDSARAGSLLAVLRGRLGGATVRYEPGPGRSAVEYVAVPARQIDSLRGEYFANNRLDGVSTVSRAEANIDFRWTLNSPARSIPFDWYSARWTGRIRVPSSGVRRLGVEGNDGYRLFVDGKLLIDNWRKQSYRTVLAPVALAPGSSHALRLEYYESTGNARLKLVWDAGVVNDWRVRVDRAVAAARLSDVTIVMVGIEEGEFRDRASLSLPGHQEELIGRVAATGKPVVVVLVGGSAVTMTRWISQVPAVLDAWYAGQAGGDAIADILLGDFNPAGRLPITFPVSEGQLPLVYNHKPTGRGDDYVDLTGYPLFPFGFGLSYTTFAYSALAFEPPEFAVGGQMTVRLRVKNSGARGGDEVVQLYVRDVLASVARPIMELKGFTRIHLSPGEEREVSFILTSEDLRMLDASMKWVTEPGVFRVMVGASSKDIRLRGELVVTP